jgi:hypothetical protein
LDGGAAQVAEAGLQHLVGRNVVVLLSSQRINSRLAISFLSSSPSHQSQKKIIGKAII